MYEIKTHNLSIFFNVIRDKGKLFIIAGHAFRVICAFLILSNKKGALSLVITD